MVFQSVIQIFELIVTDADINMLSRHSNLPTLLDGRNFLVVPNLCAGAMQGSGYKVLLRNSVTEPWMPHTFFQ
ncbi:MAG TPA: hypothetical protein DIT09_10960 [Glutamicibacter sp.]|nr:hypothetical protein [Glutamicibacter sp.]